MRCILRKPDLVELWHNSYQGRDGITDNFPQKRSNPDVTINTVCDDNDCDGDAWRIICYQQSVENMEALRIIFIYIFCTDWSETIFDVSPWNSDLKFVYFMLVEKREIREFFLGKMALGLFLSVAMLATLSATLSTSMSAKMTKVETSEEGEGSNCYWIIS